MRGVWPGPTSFLAKPGAKFLAIAVTDKDPIDSAQVPITLAEVGIAGLLKSGVDVLPAQPLRIALYLTEMVYHAVEKGIDVSALDAALHGFSISTQGEMPIVQTSLHQVH